jgi:hypothetical protein
MPALMVALALLLAVLFGAAIVTLAQVSLTASFTVAIAFTFAVSVFYFCLSRAFIKGRIPMSLKATVARIQADIAALPPEGRALLDQEQAWAAKHPVKYALILIAVGAVLTLLAVWLV